MPQVTKFGSRGEILPVSSEIALVALGSNMPTSAGTPVETLVSARAVIAERIGVIRSASEIFMTPCWPVGAGPDYANAVISLDWSGPASDLLAKLHEVEAMFDRARLQRWGMRTLDLDLIALGDLVLPDHETARLWMDLPADKQIEATPDQLILPHPRLQDRAFVLVPLMQVAPDWVHPVLKETVEGLHAKLSAEARSAVIPLANVSEGA